MRRAMALGVATVLAAEQNDPTPANFKKSVEDFVARMRSPELVDYRLFEIKGSDLPWVDLGLTAAKDQQITFLVTGRWWLSRQHDLWFRPGLAFHARTRGQRPIFSPGVDTGSMTVSHDGPIEVARLASLSADEDGRLAIPKDIYCKDDVTITGVALLWRREAAVGLASLANGGGDIGGLLAAELARLQRRRRLPEGWSNLFLLGGGRKASFGTRTARSSARARAAHPSSSGRCRFLSLPVRSSAGAGRSTNCLPRSPRTRRPFTTISPSA
jgi:hypothetical protein